jgi:hypothetical protein
MAPSTPSSLMLLLCAALPLLASCSPQDLSLSINQRPRFLANPAKPVDVYITLSIMFLGDIKEQNSDFSLDAFVDVAWRDDRFGSNSAQAFGCTKPTVGILLQMDSFAPSFCEDKCPSVWCDGDNATYGNAAPAPWSPFLEVTNVAPQFSGTALSYTAAYTNDGAPKRLGLSASDASGTWATATARFSGPILKVFPLHDFPYDKQRLDVLFESNLWTTEDVKLIPTYDPVAVKDTILSSKSMLGWDVESVTLTNRDNEYTQLNVTYNQVAMSIMVTRQSTPYGQRYIMPGFFIIIMMLCASIHAEAAVRVANGVAGFASILYLQFILTSSVPPLNYFTRLDRYMLISLIICFLSCLVGGLHVYREMVEKAAKDAEGEAKKSADSAAFQIRDPPAAAASGQARSPAQICLSRRNPFSGNSTADCLCYGLIFVAYSIASACVLLA